MRRLLRVALLALAVAVATHYAAVVALPYLSMQLAMRAISFGGERVNSWLHARPVTPDSRRVVRPAPEFAYSSCVYDLSRQPLRIHVAAWPAYWSLSLYAANTDNFLTMGDRDHPEGVELVLVQGDQAAGTVHSPSTRGIALIRRLVTDADGWSAVDAARKDDVCAPLTP
ncbi:DUF1254 domain-containing protein [Hydrocarboniphaga sp.]|uniref:DUF1254 domain-containing protein n=1 Tax=Hydrocarboniphaga sp. TaxID=2033016 RepID=UPI003D1221DC